MIRKSKSAQRPQFHPLEHQVLRDLRALDLKNRVFLLCVSGGMDSMVLLAVMLRLNVLLKWDLRVAHIHHGGKSAYRKRALKCAQNAAAKWDLRFVTNPQRAKVPQKESENSLRYYRNQALAQIVEKMQLEKRQVVFVKAHHADDLLETRLIRLVRGVAAEGLVAMKFFDGQQLRPFIELSRKQIEELAAFLKIKWCEDPSNQELDPLRNWMRHKWLPLLDKKIKSGSKTLSRSLDNLAIHDTTALWQSVIDGNRIHLAEFLPLSRQAKSDCLFYFMRQNDIKDYGFRHVREVLRRLDNDRGRLTFTLLKHQWSINAGHISVRPL